MTTVIRHEAQNFRILFGQMTGQVRLIVRAISDLRNDLRMASNCIINIGCAVYTELCGRRALMTGPERPIVEHFMLEDAIGRRMPIHLRTITSWDMLEHIIREQFQGRSGEHRVARNLYALQDHATRMEVSRSTPWNRAFRPYQKVNMSILCKQMPEASHGASKSCPWCHHVASGGDAEIQW